MKIFVNKTGINVATPGNGYVVGEAVRLEPKKWLGPEDIGAFGYVKPERNVIDSTVSGNPYNPDARNITLQNNIWFQVGDSGLLATSTDGVVWTRNQTISSVHNLVRVAFGASTFLVVSSNGSILKSIDNAVTWAVASSTSHQFTSIHYQTGISAFVLSTKAGKLFKTTDGVTLTQLYDAGRSIEFTASLGASSIGILGESGLYRRSIDGGATFTTYDIATTQTLKGLTGTTTFVVFGTGGVIFRSTSLATADWTPVTSGTTVTLNWGTIATPVSTAYMLLVGDSGTMLKSADGFAWAPVTSGTTNNLYGVSAGTAAFGRFVTGGGSFIAQSFDMNAWTARPQNSSLTNLVSVIAGQRGATALDAAGYIVESFDNKNWTAIRTCPIMSDIAYGNGVYVGVHTAGLIYSSPDGITWTSRFSGVKTDLKGVTFDGTKFRAVGANGRVLDSTDGVTWYTGTLEFADNLLDIAYNGTTFVALQSSGDVHVSTDAVKWKATALVVSTAMKAIAASSSMFVVVGTAGAVMSSPDGVTWTARTSNTASTLNSVIYANGAFVAVGAAGSIVRSTDGITWAAVTSGTAQALSGVSYATSQFIATGAAGVMVASVDGITWASFNSDNAKNINDVVFANATFMGVTNDGIAVSSTDGVNWTNRETLVQGNLRSVAFGAGLWVAVGDNGSVSTTSNLVDWTLRTSGVATQLTGVTYANTLFVATGANGVILTSIDGVTWTSRASNTTNALSRAAYLNSKWIITHGNSPAYILTSTTGLTWALAEYRTTATLDNLNGVAFGNSVYVGVGDAGRVITSTDGIYWTLSTSNVATKLNAVTYAAGLFVAVGATGTIISSPDGVTWTARTSGTSTNLTGVAYGASRFVAVGAAGYVTSSTDAITWTVPSAASFYQVAYGNSVWVATGNTDLVEISTDGEVWVKTAVTKVSMPFVGTLSLREIMFGNGLFVAVGSLFSSPSTLATVLMTSADGVTWTYRKTIAPASSVPMGTNYLSFANGMFVYSLTAPDSYTMNPNEDTLHPENVRTYMLWSADGITWSNDKVPAIADFAYGAGKYVMVDYRGNDGPLGDLYSSTDLRLWTKRTTGLNFTSVTYLNGQFIATTPSSVYTSSTGDTWTSVGGLPISTYIGSRMVYGNGRYFISGGTGGARVVATSTDLVNWTTPAISAISVAYGNSIYVAVGDPNGLWSSTDGTTWTARTSGTTYRFTRVAFGNGIFVAAATNGTATDIVYSSDGVSWSKVSMAAVNIASDLDFGNGVFKLLVQNSATPGTQISTSSNGSVWTTANAVANGFIRFYNGQFWYRPNLTRGLTGETAGTFDYMLGLNSPSSMAYVGGKYVMCCATSGRLYVSGDMRIWCASYTADTGNFITGNGSRAYLVADGGVVKTSTDLLTWSTIASGTTHPLNWATMVGTNVVATGSLGAVFRYNGTTGATDVVGTAWNCVASNGTKAVAVRSSSQVSATIPMTGTVVLWSVGASATTNDQTAISGVGSYLAAVGSTGTVQITPDGRAWSLRPAGSATFNGVGGTATVAAVGQGGVVYTSSTGIDWTSRTSPTSANLMAVANGTLLTAVGASGAVISSPDGITWTSRTSNSSYQLSSVVSAGGKLTSLGASGYMTYSTDSITWLIGLMPQLNAVAFGGTKWVIAANTGKCWFSTDAAFWVNNGNAVTTTNMTGVAYGNVGFTAVGGGTSIRSLDGSIWSSTAMPSTAFTKIVYGAEFVAVSTNGYVARSTNGTTWTSTNPDATSYNGVVATAHATVKYIAFGNLGKIKYTTTGATVIEHTRVADSAQTLFSAAYIATRYAVVGTSGEVLSKDWTNVWFKRASGTANNLVKATVFSGKIQAVGAAGATTSSSNALAWTANTVGSSNFNSLATNGTKLIGVGDADTRRITVDGAAWVDYSTKIKTTVNGSAQTGSTSFVSVANGGGVQYSTDGYLWVVKTSGTASNLNGVSYGSSTFVAVGDSGALITSADGQTWTVRSPATSQILKKVANNVGLFVAAGNSGVVVTYNSTTNASTLTNIGNVHVTPLVAGASNMTGVAYANSGFVAVGASATAAYSTAGTSWEHRYVNKVSAIFISSLGSSFVVFGEANYTLVSADARAWAVDATPRNFPDTSFASVITAKQHAFGASKLAVIRTSDSVLMTSPDAITWTTANTNFIAVDPRTTPHNAIEYGAGGFVVVGDSQQIAQSVDGVTWNLRAKPAVNAFNGGTYVGDGGKVVVGGSHTQSFIKTKLNGIATVGYSNYKIGDDGKVKFEADGFKIAVGAGGKIYINREDAWGDAVTDTTADLYAVSQGLPVVIGLDPTTGAEIESKTMFAVGDGGRILTSMDGRVWTSHSSGTTKNLRHVTPGTGKMVAVASDGTNFETANGSNWVQSAANTVTLPVAPVFTDALTNVTYSAEYGVYSALGDGSSYVSTDGVTWTNDDHMFMYPSFKKETGGAFLGFDRFVIANGLYYRAKDGVGNLYRYENGICATITSVNGTGGITALTIDPTITSDNYAWAVSTKPYEATAHANSNIPSDMLVKPSNVKGAAQTAGTGAVVGFKWTVFSCNPDFKGQYITSVTMVFGGGNALSQAANVTMHGYGTFKRISSFYPQLTTGGGGSYLDPAAISITYTSMT